MSRLMPQREADLGIEFTYVAFNLLYFQRLQLEYKELTSPSGISASIPLPSSR